MARTVTIDTNEMLFVEPGGMSSYVKNAETLTINGLTNPVGNPVWQFIDIPGGAGKNVITLSNGKKLQIDTSFSSMNQKTGGTAFISNVCGGAGSLWIREDNGACNEWRIRSVNMDNTATPTTLSLTLERASGGMDTITLSSITVGA